MRRILTAGQKVVLALVVVVATSACGASEVELPTQPCSNPDLMAGGQLWETDDTIPDEWRSQESVKGTFQVEEGGDMGVFEGPGEVRLRYRLVTEEFRSHPCRL